MKYYYLNEDKKPQGPYSESELLAFKESGLINDSTLAAVAGDAKWRPLGELLAAKVAPVEEECSTWNNELGNCPHCGKMIEAAKKWIANGAQPTETAKSRLKKSGAID